MSENKQQKKQTKSNNANGVSPTQQQISKLLEHYQNGQYGDAEALALLITQKFPSHQFSWKVLGAIFWKKGRGPEAISANQRAVELAPQDAEAHSNLGVTLKELGRLEEAEVSYRQAISLKSNFAEFHNNLGVTLQNLGRLEEAEVSYRQAIILKSDYAEAHGNLGIILQELGRLEEAEASYRQALLLKYDFAEFHNNLGVTLQELGKLEEAKESYIKATELKPDYAEPYSNLSIILSLNENNDAALECIKKAIVIDSKSNKFRLLSTVFQSRKANEKTGANFGNTGNSVCDLELTTNPLILYRAVEAELISNLYQMNSRGLDETRGHDARYGRGRCSRDFNMFEDDRSIIKTVTKDLMSIMAKAVKSKVYIYDSFFNILGNGGGTIPHNHITKFDQQLSLTSQKFALVYYLSVGDQNCSEPGFLKLYDPIEEILPFQGMLVMMPADRMHSAVYGGRKDRVMIGVNFYSI